MGNIIYSKLTNSHDDGDIVPETDRRQSVPEQRVVGWSTAESLPKWCDRLLATRSNLSLPAERRSPTQSGGQTGHCMISIGVNITVFGWEITLSEPRPAFRLKWPTLVHVSIFYYFVCFACLKFKAASTRAST